MTQSDLTYSPRTILQNAQDWGPGGQGIVDGYLCLVCCQGYGAMVPCGTVAGRQVFRHPRCELAPEEVFDA